MNRTFISILLTATLLSGLPALCRAQETGRFPKGLMLNLDFGNVSNGLIPNRAFYPLYAPLGNLVTDNLLNEPMLLFTPDEGIDIPHSSLIQPDGSEWVVTVKIGAYPDGGTGMVMSQCNDEVGYAIYLKDGAPRAVVRTGNCSMLLKEDVRTGITDCRNELAIVELRIKSDMAWLTINRKRAAMVALDEPLSGDDMPIRLGNHARLPEILKNIPGTDPVGFSGAIGTLKIWRQ